MTRIFNSIFGPNIEKLKLKKDWRSLLKALHSKNKTIREKSIMAISDLYRAALEEDAGEISVGNTYYSAIDTVGELGDKWALKLLINTLDHRDEKLRSSAASWLLDNEAEAIIDNVDPEGVNKAKSIIKEQDLKREETVRKAKDEQIKAEKASEPHWRRGLEYAQSGRYEEAIECYSQALKINPNDSFVRKLLDVACEHVQQSEAGKEFLKRIVGGRKGSIY